MGHKRHASIERRQQQKTAASRDRARPPVQRAEAPGPAMAALPSPGAILALQWTIGNAAVNQLLWQWQEDASEAQKRGEGSHAVASGQEKSGSVSPQAFANAATVRRAQAKDMRPKLALQRHAVGTELPAKDQSATEVGKKLAPSATRSKKQEAKDQTAATGVGTAFKASHALTPKAMSLAGAQAVLTGAYGGMKKIVPGTIVILADQAACSAKYDEVVIAAGITRDDGSAWAMGDCAKDDAAAGVLTEGFAWEGTVYVNGATTLVTATAHEVLHNNTASNFRKTMGETFNEGVTEYLARKALTAAGIPVPAVTAYPDQVAITTDLIGLVGEDVVMKAYFGGADSLKESLGKLATGTFAQIRAAAEGLQAATVKSLLAPKPKDTRTWRQKLKQAFA